jgi:hypothetical protein
VRDGIDLSVIARRGAQRPDVAIGSNVAAHDHQPAGKRDDVRESGSGVPPLRRSRDGSATVRCDPACMSATFCPARFVISVLFVSGAQFRNCVPGSSTYLAPIGEMLICGTYGKFGRAARALGGRSTCALEYTFSLLCLSNAHC